MEDLDKAIDLEKEALTLRLERDPGRSTSLNSLGICFSTRYNETGELQNLSDGIHLGCNACDSGAETHPLRSSRLSNLAGSLPIRYGRLGAKEDPRSCDFPRASSTQPSPASALWSVSAFEQLRRLPP